MLSWHTDVSGSTRGQRRRRPPGIDVRPGTVRSARLDAGLSLAGVAGSQVTRAAIHLVETGRARPSERTLRLIASRTGKPVSFFTASDARRGQPARRGDRVSADLRRLEGLVATRQLADAERYGERLLAGADAMRASLKGRILMRLAQASLESGDAVRAAERLQVARDLLPAADPALQAECVDSLGVAQHRLESADALATLHEALRLCRSTTAELPHLESTILGHIGAVYVCRHDWVPAKEHYERALQAAGNLRDISLLERMHNGLGLAEMGSGQLAAALDHFQKALALAEVSNEPRIVARLENNMGSVLIELGEFESAESHLAHSLTICEETGLEVGRGHVLCSLVELFLARQDYPRAGAHVRQALAVTHRIGEKLTEADAHQLAGQLAELQGDESRADRSFQSALEILRGEGASSRRIECEAAYAEILHARGDTAGALIHTTAALYVAHPSLPARAAVPRNAGRAQR
jgi:tetratricopeptide (TPR) repeat protein